jgi:hypothetical protein
MQPLILSLGYVVYALNTSSSELVPIREIPSCTTSPTVQRETFKFNQERSRGTRKNVRWHGISPFRSSHVRMPGNINACRNAAQIDQRLWLGISKTASEEIEFHNKHRESNIGLGTLIRNSMSSEHSRFVGSRKYNTLMASSARFLLFNSAREN